MYYTLLLEYMFWFITVDCSTDLSLELTLLLKLILVFLFDASEYLMLLTFFKLIVRSLIELHFLRQVKIAIMNSKKPKEKYLNNRH